MLAFTGLLVTEQRILLAVIGRIVQHRKELQSHLGVLISLFVCLLIIHIPYRFYFDTW